MTLYISKDGINPMVLTEIQRGTEPGLPQAAYTTQTNPELSQNPTPDAQIVPNSQEPDLLGLDLPND